LGGVGEGRCCKDISPSKKGKRAVLGKFLHEAGGAVGSIVHNVRTTRKGTVQAVEKKNFSTVTAIQEEGVQVERKDKKCFSGNKGKGEENQWRRGENRTVNRIGGKGDVHDSAELERGRHRRKGENHGIGLSCKGRWGEREVGKEKGGIKLGRKGERKLGFRNYSNRG